MLACLYSHDAFRCNGSYDVEGLHYALPLPLHACILDLRRVSE